MAKAIVVPTPSDPEELGRLLYEEVHKKIDLPLVQYKDWESAPFARRAEFRAVEAIIRKSERQRTLEDIKGAGTPEKKIFVRRAAAMLLQHQFQIPTDCIEKAEKLWAALEAKGYTA